MVMSAPTSEEICVHCEEPILPGDQLSPIRGPLHFECGIRLVAGGVNHLKGLCWCCGGTLTPDPDGMSKRQAARMAAEEWHRVHPT